MPPPESLGITASVVSHGHSAWVQALLHQLAGDAQAGIAHVVLTHNLPEPALVAPAQGWPFQLTEQFNPRPAGFGANHNAAFQHCGTPFFCVLNPDIELPDASVWPALRAEASLPGVGCAYPALLNPDGSRQDNEREAVTPWALVRRHFLARGRPERRDWVSAAFWLVPAQVYRSLGGFDERYFMYCEDADFCLRLQLAGWQLRRAEASAVHAASRASRASAAHLAWHLRSLLRLWCGPVLRRYLARRRT